MTKSRETFEHPRVQYLDAVRTKWTDEGLTVQLRYEADDPEHGEAVTFHLHYVEVQPFIRSMQRAHERWNDGICHELERFNPDD